MAKNSPKPKPQRRPTDGGVPIAKLPGILGGAGGGQLPLPDSLRFDLSRVNTDALAVLAIGMRVAIDHESRGLAVKRGNTIVGFVPGPLVKRVKGLMSRTAFTAEISDLPHEGVEVTLQWR